MFDVLRLSLYDLWSAESSDKMLWSFYAHFSTWIDDPASRENSGQQSDPSTQKTQTLISCFFPPSHCATHSNYSSASAGRLSVPILSYLLNWVWTVLKLSGWFPVAIAWLHIPAFAWTNHTKVAILHLTVCISLIVCLNTFLPFCAWMSCFPLFLALMFFVSFSSCVLTSFCFCHICNFFGLLATMVTLTDCMTITSVFFSLI